MAETTSIPVVTSLRTEGNTIFIKTEYFEAGILPNTIQAFIASLANNIDSISYIGGELVIQMQDHPEAIDYYINDIGELIILSNTGDFDNYFINENGHLFWEGDDLT